MAAGYDDTKKLIIDALMGRPAGTQIQPEKHQSYALSLLEYVRTLELSTSSILAGVASEFTVPLRPKNSSVCYIATIAQKTTVTFHNFFNEEGNSISVTTGGEEAKFVVLIWNQKFWSVEATSISYSYNYKYNIRKTYTSVANMNLDSSNPIGIDGSSINIGDIVTVNNINNKSENGIYSKTADGWQFQNSLDFIVAQTTGTSTSEVMSQKAVTDALNSILKEITSISKAISNIEKENEGKFLRKDSVDVAAKLITFLEGLISDDLKSKDYTPGPLGSGMRFWTKDGKSYAEVDNLQVRMEAIFKELIVQKSSWVGGEQISSLAAMKCTKVEEYDTYFRCYFDRGIKNESGVYESENEFVTFDQARCVVFTGSKQKYYWRLVVDAGVDYIDLSKVDFDGTDYPEVGDKIMQLGNRNNKKRQNAIIISSYGVDAPSIKQYTGIHSYNLTGCEGTVISPNGNKLTAGANNTIVPADRGAWIEGEKYYYYDRVSNRGALWLCIIQDGAYTTEEPLNGSSSWVKQVNEGADGVSKGVNVQGENIFKYNNTMSFMANPSSILLSVSEDGYTSTPELRKWEYKSGFDWIEIPDERDLTLLVLPDSEMWSGVSLTFKFTSRENNTSDEYFDIFTITKLFDGQDSYKVQVMSSNGNFFRNSVISSTLTALVYKGGIDITNTLNQDCFRWIRVSNDPEADVVWNLKYSTYGSNVISITEDDVLVSADFKCNVTINFE